MNTRSAADPAEFHQNRYASSPEFERGLLANLVAKRAALLVKKDRELIWFLHYLSHQEGGLAALVKDLLANYPGKFGTESMVAFGPEVTTYSADQVMDVRNEIPDDDVRKRFPLKGHLKSELTNATAWARSALEPWEREAYDAADLADSDKHPSTYPAESFLAACREVAAQNLETDLKVFCLDPGGDRWPWYFFDMVATLREYQADWSRRQNRGADTELSRIVAREFDYTLRSRCLSLLVGDARRGKTFAVNKCCLMNPGRARFVEVPPGNDAIGFYRALARGLGLGSFLNYKAVEIEERVKSVLLSGDLLLVLDEAQRLWPERNHRYAYPSRITWVMALANQKVPILLVGTPQFLTGQNIAEKNGWNSAQLTGRIFKYRKLPSDLADADLVAVARSFLPEADSKVLAMLAAYAKRSARYIAAIESIATHARYLAEMDGRTECGTEDIRTAMRESVIPSDAALGAALATAKDAKQKRIKPAAPELPPSIPSRDCGVAVSRQPVALVEETE